MLRRLRRRVLVAALGMDLPGEVSALRDSLARQEGWHRDRIEFQSEVHRRMLAQTEIAKLTLDKIDELTSKLRVLRSSPQYSATMSDRSPLVTVRIAAYTRTEELMDLAIPSVLAQSYDRIELVIVNDGPNSETRHAVEQLHDKRIRFLELPERGEYPEDPRSRWMVAGTAPINAATDLAKGSWIAHLDDDDEFSPDHIERLLNVAWNSDAELSYGALHQVNLITGDEQILWSDTPTVNRFSFQGSLYLTALKFFRYDASAWVLNEPGDWNLIRRMKAAGVRMASTPDIVGRVNMVPYTHKTY